MEVSGMKEMYFKKDLTKLKSFRENVRQLASSKGLEKQENSENNDSWVCQIKKDSKVTLSIGSKAVTILVESFSEDTIKVSIGEGKWLSKIAGGIVTSVASGPLFLLALPTTVAGVYGQAKLQQEIVSLANLTLA